MSTRARFLGEEEEGGCSSSLTAGRLSANETLLLPDWRRRLRSRTVGLALEGVERLRICCDARNTSGQRMTMPGGGAPRSRTEEGVLLPAGGGMSSVSAFSFPVPGSSLLCSAGSAILGNLNGHLPTARSVLLAPSRPGFNPSKSIFVPLSVSLYQFRNVLARSLLNPHTCVHVHADSRILIRIRPCYSD